MQVPPTVFLLESLQGPVLPAPSFANADHIQLATVVLDNYSTQVEDYYEVRCKRRPLQLLVDHVALLKPSNYANAYFTRYYHLPLDMPARYGGYCPSAGGLTTGLSPLAADDDPAADVGVTLLEIGVEGLSPSSFFVDGVEALLEVPDLGL